MSSSNSKKKENKNVKALFSVVCLCIISLGLVIYFSTMTKEKDNTVNQPTTIVETTEVQHAITHKEIITSTTKLPESTTKKPTTTQPVTMEQGKNNIPYKSFYKYPLTEAVSKGYSEELTLDKTMNDFRAHSAVDFSGAINDKVVAINDGLVKNVYKDDKYGLCVEIDHGAKLVVKYCGLESASVKKGDFVDIGNQIGTLGKVPCESSDGVHLHLSAKLNGKSVNPMDIMGKTE